MPRYTALVPAILAVYVDAPDAVSARKLIKAASDEADANPRWENGVWGTALSIDGRPKDLRTAERGEGDLPDEYKDTETCPACGESTKYDNDGYDGYCGNCADIIQEHADGAHAEEAREDCPTCKDPGVGWH